jgi:hypothetical protein
MWEQEGHEPLPPWAGSKRLTHWTSESVYWSEAAGPPQGPPPPQQLGSGSDCSLCFEDDLQGAEWNQGRSIVRSQRIFHIVGMVA